MGQRFHTFVVDDNRHGAILDASDVHTFGRWLDNTFTAQNLPGLPQGEACSIRIGGYSTALAAFATLHGCTNATAIVPRGPVVSFLSSREGEAFGHEVNMFIVHVAAYLRYLAERPGVRPPKILLSHDAMMLDWYKLSLGTIVPTQAAGLFISVDPARDTWFDFSPDSLLHVNTFVESRFGLQDAANEVVPHLLRGATEQVRDLSQHRGGRHALIVQLKNSTQSNRVTYKPSAMDAVAHAFQEAGYYRFDGARHSAAQKPLIFAHFDVYVTEWGSPLSYALLNLKPSLVFTFANRIYTDAQAKDPTYQYNILHHVVYVAANVENRGEPSEWRQTAKTWLGKIDQITRALRAMPSTLLPLRERWLRYRNGSLPCPSRLFWNCAVDSILS